jgi:tetratricopeptide (TPR) repeat protein/TolB-like protein
MTCHWARWAYALNPDDEADLRKLIDVLVRAGDHSGALRAYQEFSERVSREYEIEPSNATQALLEPLRAAHSAATHAPVTVRERTTPFAPYTPYIAPLPATIAQPVEPATVGAAKPRRNWRRLAGVATAGASVAAVLVMVDWQRTRTASAPAGEAIAVFPFSVRGSEQLAYLREGMVDLLSAKLDGGASLRSVDPRAVLSASHATDSLANAQPRALAGISRRLGAGAFVIGDVVELAGRVNVSGALYEVGNTSRPLTKVSVEGDVAALPQLVDQLAGQLLAARAKGRDPALTRLAALTTSSLPALRAFLEGESEFRAGHGEAAREAFRAALRYDSTFALAYIRLATTQGWSSATGIDPLALLATARRFNSRLSPLARALLDGYEAYYRGDGLLAEQIFADLARTYPDRVESWFMLAETQTHLAAFNGHALDEARPAFERVLALDRDNPHALVHLARLAAEEERTDDLKALVARYLRTNTGDRALEMRALRAFSLDDPTETTEVLSEARRASSLDLYTALSAATSYAQNAAAAAQLSSIASESSIQTQSAFNLVFSLLPLPSLMQGRVIRGVPTRGEELFDGSWPTKLRALLLMGLPVALPGLELRALRDTLAVWQPGAAPSLAIFAFDSVLQPQIRAYLLGAVSTRLNDQKGVESALAALSAMSRAQNDSGNAADFSHLVRAERARSQNRLQDALKEVEQFHFAPSHLANYGFRPAFAHARFLRAEILHALGRDEEALRWYGSLGEAYDAMYLPLVHFRTGEILRRAGDVAGATRHYRRFLIQWKECDPELRPLVDLATVAIGASPASPSISRR